MNIFMRVLDPILQLGKDCDKITEILSSENPPKPLPRPNGEVKEFPKQAPYKVEVEVKS